MINFGPTPRHSGPLMAFIMIVIFVFVCSAPATVGQDTRKLAEATPGTQKCTPCTPSRPPPSPPPPAPCPPPPALPSPPPPALPHPSPKKKPPTGQYCPPPPPPPSSYIYITGPPGSVYPIDQDFGAASQSSTSRLLLFIGFGLLGLVGWW